MSGLLYSDACCAMSIMMFYGAHQEWKQNGGGKK